MTTDALVRSSGSATFQLRAAILLYQGPESAVYATIHQIERHRKGGPRLGAGQPATREACGAFARQMTEAAAFRGWLAPEILFVGPRTVAWWRSPAPARLFFETLDAKHRRRHLGTRNVRSMQPGLVFVLAEGDWRVYAVKGAERPGPATPLWRAPYFNVWADGRICEGNVERPARVGPETLAGFERAFFDSRFTHPNEESRRLTRHRGGVYALWREALEGRHARAFPESSLLPHGRHTLETLLRALEKGPDRP